MIIALVVTIFLGYLLGSISFSYLLAKHLRKIDIRTSGSGNAGATNTLRVLGVGPAITVLVLDILKGVVPVWVALLWVGESSPVIPALAGLAAIIGHNWPVFFHFRGGKGVATTIGVLATLLFYPSFIAGCIAIISIVVTRYVSLGSLLFGIMTPVMAWCLLPFRFYPYEYIFLSMLLMIVSLWRHRENVSRLLSGTENKIGKKQM
ncbi:glycerol-3-phosphate 1-O-acyltransferase PlsY [Shouchella lonarensis]|uniref:Glycerol-3-phosphate acyltransferase n=1 Tax=Shouchella lonarensis TaxID=1464122 RepID=A0A1G6J1F2_9BACI|nr:glycerol-3-phosphate 1-O-acyltransferase PlsY [Shouchella lonarensis]SDC12413.1 acyl-phosphate glycerol-3-phosphate acyltransferase [Shouchella lonarensis]